MSAPATPLLAVTNVSLPSRPSKRRMTNELADPEPAAAEEEPCKRATTIKSFDPFALRMFCKIFCYYKSSTDDVEAELSTSEMIASRRAHIRNVTWLLLTTSSWDYEIYVDCGLTRDFVVSALENDMALTEDLIQEAQSCLLSFMWAKGDVRRLEDMYFTQSDPEDRLYKEPLAPWGDQISDLERCVIRLENSRETLEKTEDMAVLDASISTVMRGAAFRGCTTQDEHRDYFEGSYYYDWLMRLLTLTLYAYCERKTCIKVRRSAKGRHLLPVLQLLAEVPTLAHHMSQNAALKTALAEDAAMALSSGRHFAHKSYVQMADKLEIQLA